VRLLRGSAATAGRNRVYRISPRFGSGRFLLGHRPLLPFLLLTPPIAVRIRAHSSHFQFQFPLQRFYRPLLLGTLLRDYTAED
jgi:hypothetical protein